MTSRRRPVPPTEYYANDNSKAFYDTQKAKIPFSEYFRIRLAISIYERSSSPRAKQSKPEQSTDFCMLSINRPWHETLRERHMWWSETVSLNQKTAHSIDLKANSPAIGFHLQRKNDANTLQAVEKLGKLF